MKVLEWAKISGQNTKHYEDMKELLTKNQHSIMYKNPVNVK